MSTVIFQQIWMTTFFETDKISNCDGDVEKKRLLNNSLGKIFNRDVNIKAY